MNTKRTIIFVALALVTLAGGIIYWHRFSQTERSSALNKIAEQTNGVVASQETFASPDTASKIPPIDETRRAVSEQANIETRPGATHQLPSDFNRPEADLTQLQNQTGTEDWKKPINFYGKVVDENTNPITGANIGFVWNDISATGTSHASTTSDASGLFSLTGVSGRGLSVNVSKTGYYYVKHLNRNSFEYARDYEPNFHLPDANNPVVFHLRKKGSGTKLITSQYGVFPDLEFNSPKDGGLVRVNFFNRKVGSEGQLEISQTKPAYESWKTATQWSYRLAIPDGGFVEHDDEFPFEAPDTGYQPIVEFTFNQGQPNWATKLSKDYYVVFGNPHRYGRIHIETSISTGTVLTYAINPNGSRYLEPK